MAVIKGKERVLNKKSSLKTKNTSEKAKKILKRPQDVQPIPTVGGF